MPETVIRPATAADLDRLCTLYLEFHNFHATHLPNYLRLLSGASAVMREELKRKIGEIIHGDESVILVADSAGHVVGMAEIYLKQPDASNQAVPAMLTAHLQSLAVTQDFKKMGIGKQLLEAAEAWAQSHGAEEIHLDTWEFAAGPLDFYEKFGYHTIKRSLARRLK